MEKFTSKPKFYCMYIKVGFKGVYITYAGEHDVFFMSKIRFLGFYFGNFLSGKGPEASGQALQCYP